MTAKVRTHVHPSELRVGDILVNEPGTPMVHRLTRHEDHTHVYGTKRNGDRMGLTLFDDDNPTLTVEREER